jgi:hypothetical protein
MTSDVIDQPHPPGRTLMAQRPYRPGGPTEEELVDGVGPEHLATDVLA